MKTLTTMLLLIFACGLSHAQRERLVSKQPELISASVVHDTEGEATISVVLSGPALIVNDLPVVVFYRPTLKGISAISPGNQLQIHHLILPSSGRGFRTPDAEIPLRDKTGKKVGSMKVDRDDFRNVIFKIPSEWISGGGRLAIGIIHAIEPQTKTEQDGARQPATRPESKPE